MPTYRTSVIKINAAFCQTMHRRMTFRQMLLQKLEISYIKFINDEHNLHEQKRATRHFPEFNDMTKIGHIDILV
jgi:hypothetical protein